MAEDEPRTGQDEVPAAVAPEADPQQLAMEYEAVQRRLMSLDQHMVKVEAGLTEVQQAMATLDGLEGAEDAEGLVPIGGGVQVPARLGAGDKVILHVGGGYSTEATIDDARTRLQARSESLQGAYRATNQEVEQLAMAMEDMRQQMAALPPS